MKHMTRRELAKTFGAASLLLAPVLRQTRAAAQLTSRHAHRFIFMHQTNGLTPAEAFPKRTSGLGFDLAGTNLEALTPFKSQLVISKIVQRGQASHGMNNTALTGIDREGIRGGPSIDYVMARRLGVRDPIGQLNLWVSKRERPSERNTLSFDASGVLPPVRDALQLYNQVASKFRCTSSTPGMPMSPANVVDPRRKKILDMVRSDLTDARRVLGMGAEELQILERHVAAADAAEARLSTLGQQGASGAAVCDRGGLAEAVKGRVANAGMSINTLSRFMIDVMVLAMATDLTRVGTLMYFAEGGACATTGDFLPIAGAAGQNLHEISHAGNSSAPIGKIAQPWYTAMQKWFAGEFAYLLRSLQAIPDVGGTTMLDTSLSNLATSIGHGASHPQGNLWVVAGANGYFKRGAWYAEDAIHTRMLLSQLHAMGLEDIKQFGKNWMPGETPLLPTA